MIQRLPADLIAGVEAALTRNIGRTAAVVRAAPVGGGCIHNATRLDTELGDTVFAKWGPRTSVQPGMFRSEAAGLSELADAETLRVPTVLGIFDPDDDAAAPERPTAWLLLEWLEPASADAGTWQRLGHGLAALHHVRAERWGAALDNFIGTLRQPGGWFDDWAEFWRECRLGPQLRLAYDAGYFGPADRQRFDRLLDGLEDALAGAEHDGASLLHGDLWSGNVHVTTGGEPALIDPATYHGHREVDLAMAELFGGFQPAFFRAYDEAWPLEPAYRQRRRAVYQLYYLLVHVNIFGGGYVGSTVATLGEAGG